MILDVEATRSIRRAEVGTVRTMVGRVRARHVFKPERLIADTAYGTGPMLSWLADHGIAPYIPVIDKSGLNDGTFERADFTFDTESDTYICPGGKELKQYRRVLTKRGEPRPDKDGILRYRARKFDCEICPLMSRCCPKEPQRKVRWSIHEPSRNVARAIAQACIPD